MTRVSPVFAALLLACASDSGSDDGAGSSGTDPGSSSAGTANPTVSGDPSSVGDDASGTLEDTSVGDEDGSDSSGAPEGTSSESTGDEPVPRDAIAVAVGYGTRRVRSEDGLEWTDFVEVDPNGGDDDNLLRGIGYGDGVFLAVGGGGAGFSMRSTDGITWQDENHELTAFVSDAVYLDGTFVIAGGNGLRARSQDGGVTWQDGSPYFAGHYRAIAVGNGTVVAIGHTYGDTNVGLVATTEDGATWTAEQTMGAPHSGGSLSFGAGVFVARDDEGDVRSSADGMQWSEVQLDLEGSGNVVYADGGFVTAGDGAYWTSDDGVQWTELSSETVRGPVGWIDGHWLTLGWPASIDASDDLQTWQNVFAPGGSGLTDIAVGSPS